jgi:hypothetical protein
MTKRCSVQVAGFGRELNNKFGILPLQKPSEVGTFKGEVE